MAIALTLKNNSATARVGNIMMDMTPLKPNRDPARQLGALESENKELGGIITS